MHRSKHLVLFAVALSGILICGCDDKRRHSASAGLALSKTPCSLPADAPPGAVAESLARAIAAAQAARADGLGSPERKADYDKALGQIWSFADRSDIYENVRRVHGVGIPVDVSEDAACTLIIESWISEVAHYIAGVNYDTRRITPEQYQADCIVHFEAESPSDKAELASIESSLPAPATDKDGTTARLATIRDRAVEEGFNIPVETSIDITLKKKDDGWRAVNIGLSMALNRSRTVTSMPAKKPTGT